MSTFQLSQRATCFYIIALSSIIVSWLEFPSSPIYPDPSSPAPEVWLKEALGPGWALAGKHPTFTATQNNFQLNITFTESYPGTYGSHEFREFLTAQVRSLKTCTMIFSDRRQPFFFNNQGVLSAFFHGQCTSQVFVSGLFIPSAKGSSAPIALWFAHSDQKLSAAQLAEWHKRLRRLRIEP